MFYELSLGTDPFITLLFIKSYHLSVVLFWLKNIYYFKPAYCIYMYIMTKPI